MNELNKIKEQINKLTNLHSNVTEENKEISEQKRIKNWMKDTIKLEICSNYKRKANKRMMNSNTNYKGKTMEKT